MVRMLCPERKLRAAAGSGNWAKPLTNRRRCRRLRRGNGAVILLYDPALLPRRRRS